MKKVIFILLILSLSIYAQTKRDPRVVAMAGAYTTISDGIFSVGYNPGMIGLQQNRPFMMQGFQLDFGLLGNFQERMQELKSILSQLEIRLFQGQLYCARSQFEVRRHNVI